MYNQNMDEMRKTIYEWAKEIDNKFSLFLNLLNDDLEVDAKTSVEEGIIKISVEVGEENPVTDEEIEEIIRDTVERATAECPYDFMTIIDWL